MGENTVNTADDDFSGYEMSAAIDPSFELLLIVVLYCCAISFLVFFVVRNGQPRRFSRLVENVEEKVSLAFRKIGSALRKRMKTNEEKCDNTISTEDDEVGSTTPYQSLDLSRNENSSNKDVPGNSIAEKKAPTEPYRWPGLCNLVNEMITIHKLAAPWLLMALVSHGYSIAVIFLISHYIGEDDAIAYAAVEFYLYVFSLISGGIYDSFYRNANVAIGSGDHELVGQQTNVSMLLAGVASIPAIIFSLFWMEDFLLWMGFDDYIAAKGHDYALLASCLSLFESFNDIWWSLLDLTGHEFFAAGFDFSEVVSGMTLIAIAIVHYDFDLWKLGLLNIAHSIAWTIISLSVVAWTGWLKPYYRGIFSTASLGNSKAYRGILKTAAPLILVSISLDVEWRILSLIIDRAHGPAEAAAWILLDYVWALLETWTDTFASAAQQVVTNYLYSGSLHQARATTNATLVYGFVYSCFESLFVVLISTYVIGVLTPDETLMAIMGGIIPYMALGNPFVSIGTIASSLNESQGRYWVSVGFYWLSSLFITIPVAAVLSFALDINAEGIAAAVVMGCTTSGVAHVGLLVESDYEKVIANWEKEEDSNAEDAGLEFIETGTKVEDDALGQVGDGDSSTCCSINTATAEIVYT
jgi:Na+-driven multidrug efflux pump